MVLTFEDHTRGKLINAKYGLNQFLDQKMDYYYNKFVIPECQRLALAANLPMGFVTGFEFRKTGFCQGKVVNTFGNKDEPLAKWYNYGTKRYYRIAPKVEHPPGGPRAARDVEDVGEGHIQHPSVLHWKDPETGEDVYRPEVIHPGFPRTEILEIGVQEGLKILKIEVEKDVRREFSDHESERSDN